MKLETRNSKLGTLLVVSFLSGAALSVPAVTLQFTNISATVLPTLGSRLAAVAYGGSSNFVAVGDEGTFVRGVFTPNQPYLALANWTSGSVAAGASNLLCVASSGDLFVASGVSNAVFSSLDGANWTSSFKVFGNQAWAAGMAYNNNRFVAVATAPEIGWTALPLPTTTNWTQAKTFSPDLSFAESFRAVTPYGAGNFAACGVFGAVRVSTNGGDGWRGISGAIGKPDLLGITTAGSTLVCVGGTNAATGSPGTNGVILVSTNGGTDWLTVYTNTGVNTPLCGVANLGPGFLAVGKNGALLTSPDGITWTSVPADAWRGASPTSEDLFGVTFATANFMQGVGAVVGAHGTVILAGVPPQMPTNDGDKSRCHGSPLTDSPLSVTIVNDSYHPVGTIAVDWYTAPSAGALVASATNLIIPTDDLPLNPNTASNYFYYAEARDLRTGFVSTNRTKVTLTINPRPTALVSRTGPSPICNGDSTTIKADLTGIAPWTVTWSDGVVQSGLLTGPAIRTVNPVNPELNTALTTNYTVTALVDSNCTARAEDRTGQATVVINPRPTATVTGTQSICNGGAATIQAALTGLPPGPWTVTWSDGFVQTVGASPAVRDQSTMNLTNIYLNATTNYTFTVVALSNAVSGCVALGATDLFGQAVITVYPRPTTTLASVNRTNCNDGSAYTIVADLTGLGPWTVTWWDGAISNVVVSPATRTVYPTNTLANAPVYYSFWVEALSDSHCTAFRPWGDFTGTNVVRVNPRPTSTLISLDRTNCNDGSSYVIQAALTGLGPWAVTWWDGAVSNVVASPANRTVYPTNELPNAAVVYTYWVQALADTNCVANQPGDLMGTNTVRVNPRPTSDVSGTATLCNGGSTVVQATLTGLGPWDVSWSSNGVVVATHNGVVSSPDTLNVAPVNPNANSASTHTYTVSALSDANCTANSGDRTGSAVITVNPRPTATVSGTTAICNGSSTTVQAALTGIGPWNVTWSSNGVVVATHNGVGSSTDTLLVTPVNPNANTNSTHTYTVTALTDAHCTANAGDLTGSAVVTVNPRPTSVVTGTTAICNGSSTTVQAALTGIGPWNVTWSSNGVIVATHGGVVATTDTLNVTPVDPDPNAASTHTYTVSALTDAHCTANAGDRTGSAVITVNPRPTSVVSGTTTICNGSSAAVQAALTGIGPWNVTWSSNGVPVVTNTGVIASPDTLNVSPTNTSLGTPVTATYTVTALSDANCTANAGDRTGSALITINPRPTAAVSGSTSICNGDSATLSVALTGIGTKTLMWSDGFTQSTNGATALRVVSPVNVLANVATNFTYTVTNLTDANCTAGAGDLNGSATVMVRPRPIATLTGHTNFCTTGTAVVRADLAGQQPFEVIWSITTNNTLAYITNTVTTNYDELVLTLTNGTATTVFTNLFSISVSNADVAEGCSPFQTASVVAKVYPTLSATVTDGTTPVATNGNVTLTAILTGTPGWTLIWSDGYTQTTNGAVAARTVFGTTVAALGGSFDYYVTNLVDSSSNSCPASLLGTNTLDTVVGEAWVVSGDATICSNQCATIQVTLASFQQGGKTYGSPWVVHWADGAVSNYVSSPGTRLVCPTAPTSYSVDYVIATNVAKEHSSSKVQPISGSAAITVNPLPSVFTVSGTATICDGQSNDILLTGSQLGVTYSLLADGTPAQTQPGTGSAIHFTVSPAATITNYTVWASNDTTGCLGQMAGSATVTVNPLPAVTSVTVASNSIICLGDSTYIQVGLTGAPPWAVTWSDGVTDTGVTNNPWLRLISPTNSGTFTYSVTNLTDANVCYATSLGGSVVVSVTNCAPLTIFTNAPTLDIYWGGNRWLKSAADLTGPWTNIMQGTNWTTTNFWSSPISTNQEFFGIWPPTNGP